MCVIGGHDVLASATDAGLDREERRAPPERSIHLSKPVPRSERASEEFQRGHIGAVYCSLDERRSLCTIYNLHISSMIIIYAPSPNFPCNEFPPLLQ